MPKQTQVPKGQQTRTGRVDRIVADRGFFFLKDDESLIDHFAHFSALENCQLNELQVGDRVSFIPEPSPKGPRAGSINKMIGNR